MTEKLQEKGLSESAHSSLTRLKIILSNIEIREQHVDPIPPLRMEEIEDYIKFSVDWLLQAYKRM